MTIRNFLHSTSTKIILQQPWTPSLRKHNDRNIMDDAMKYLPTANLKAINNVRIHLQVCYLSEITDANRLVLLPEITTCHTAATHLMLLWPHQPIPPPDAWKQWSWAIHMLYTRPNSDRLQQPLTMWQQTAMNENWNWEWRVNPHKRALYHWNQTHWTVRYPHNARRTYIDYTMHQ